MTPALHADAMVLHLFVAADGPHRADDHEYLHRVWERCRTELGMTVGLLGVDLPTDLRLAGGAGLLAGLRRPDAHPPYVQEALLRREHDTFCLTVMREPPDATWADLQREWEDATRDLDTPPGILGLAQLFLARTTDDGLLGRVARRRGPDPATMDRVVRTRLPEPADLGAEPTPASRWGPGTTFGPGFAVWEASEPADDRLRRRLVVLARDDADLALSAWTWVAGADRGLPPLGRYLMHAAKLRHQLRVWSEQAGFRGQRRTADATVDRLLALVADETAPPERLLAASRELVELQVSERGLVHTLTALREMRRTVEIATANLTSLGGATTGGLFADDRELGSWFGQQLDDDAVYVGAARERAGHVGALVDQTLRHREQVARERSQARQERIAIGLTGAVGAVLMVLAAFQSLVYQPPLSPLVKPAVAGLLGAIALLTTLVVLRVAAARWWSTALVWVGSGLIGASAAWVVVSATLGDLGSPATTRGWAALGLAAGVAIAAVCSTVAARRHRA